MSEQTRQYSVAEAIANEIKKSLDKFERQPIEDELFLKVKHEISQILNKYESDGDITYKIDDDKIYAFGVEPIKLAQMLSIAGKIVKDKEYKLFSYIQYRGRFVYKGIKVQNSEIIYDFSYCPDMPLTYMKTTIKLDEGGDDNDGEVCS